MKTLHILALALALTVSPVLSTANAGMNDVAVHESSDSSATVIHEKIQNTVRLENTDENARVFVVFSIAENGEVSVHEIGSMNPAVRASITEQFETMNFDNANSNYDGMYSIWLNFKTL